MKIPAFLATSLKLRLGLGAALLGLAAMLSAAILFVGMTRVGDRLDTALSSEQRMARYANLSTQVSTFLVIAAESAQSGLPRDQRAERLEPVANNIRAAFAQLRADLEIAVEQARDLGIDQQSRHGTQSLGIARMEAMFANTLSGLSLETDRDRMRAYIDTFASGFDPLLNQAVNAEVFMRNDILRGIRDLRQTLNLAALVIAVIALLAVAAFYFGLVRPQFARLDMLRDAAQRIAQADFDLSLPDSQRDEIGQLFQDTNIAAQALSYREAQVQIEAAYLTQTIDQRTHELRHANTKLEEIDENRRRFFADVSHELRTPLTVILMEAQIGQKGTPDPTAAFATIETRAARLNRRIDDLLRVARSDSGQLQLDPHPVTLSDLAEDACAEVAAELESAAMDLIRRPLPDTVLMCDPNWARQVLVELIRNAIRHARDGRTVRLIPLASGALAGIGVQDNGPGIAPHQQGNIFARFAKGTTGDGFGIGLALARWVITEQGGEISLTSPLPDPLGNAPGLQISVLLPTASG